MIKIESEHSPGTQQLEFLKDVLAFLRTLACQSPTLVLLSFAKVTGAKHYAHSLFVGFPQHLVGHDEKQDTDLGRAVLVLRWHLSLSSHCFPFA